MSSAAMITFHPAFSSPIRSTAGTRTFSKNTWFVLKSACVCTGWIVIPGVFRSTMKTEMPRCLLSASPVRTASQTWLV
jgi:hypothetical protein